MLNLDFTFFWTAVNLLVLYLFLNKFLFKRLEGFMEARTASIAADIEKGETLKGEGEEYRQKHEALLEQVANERSQILREARQKADKEYENILTEAKEEASRILAAAREDGEREYQKNLLRLRDEVVSLALAAASKVIEANMDNERNRALVEEFLNAEEAA